ncbi:MAG: GNAT family N-acetyltransferase, partial [Oscillospiraceae bacterium]|nr:GNAT family N-acetyltransferase [Oscillospiraceae bacterium]
MGNIDIALADYSHLSGLKELWVEAFGDDEPFIASFLKEYMIPGHNAPAAIVEGAVVSALYLLDFPLYSKGQILGDCAYLFAAATKQEYKNRGYMSALVGYAAELCQSRGQHAIFLFPQGGDPKLFDFYSRFGYRSVYAAKKITRRPPRRPAPGFRLTQEDIADPAVFGRLYGAYSEFTAGQPLAPKKDRLFYLRCAASYLEAENARFALL